MARQRGASSGQWADVRRAAGRVSVPWQRAAQATATLRMARFAALIGCVALLQGGQAAALRLPSEEPVPPVRVYALWNRQYLCLAARVPDPMLTGTSTSPMSAPEQDDAIEFSFEVPSRLGAAAHRLIISAAGGMTLYSRDSRGQWRVDPTWVTSARTLKFSVTTSGTLNDPTDRDAGFAVECAIPWEFLGGEPPAGAELGFNVVSWMQGENEGIASWSPSVHNPSQASDAARWGKMVVSAGSVVTRAVGLWVPCAFSARAPFIDGRLGAEEWLTATTLEFSRPEPMIEIALKPSERTGVAAAVTAIYRYDWQGGLGATAGAPLWTADGAPATGNQPRSGAGPWVSYQRVDWHAQQLAEVQRAGIDIILARYCGEDRARRTWARIGLDRLAQALKERRAQGLGYPLVGMMLDTRPLAGADLRSEEGKRLIYGMIREFLLHVPREFWAEMGANPEKGIAGGLPVLLGEPDGLAGWDGDFLTYSQRRVADEFSGARLVWLGSSAWRTEGVEFYNFISLPQEAGFTASAPGGAQAVGISPGRCPPPGQPGQIRARTEGKSYRSDWQKALAGKPELVVINSWNDYAEGTEIAPSRQYGVIYVDMTRYFQSRLGSQEPHHLWLKQPRVPEPLTPGAEYLIEFLVENVGTEDLRSDSRVSADYEIRRRSDGALVAARGGAQTLDIAAGQTERLPVLITTRDDRGRPLPPGDYLFTMRVTKSKIAYLRSKWIARAAAELTVPFTVGEPPAHKAMVISTSLPAYLETGATETVVVRLRNDGAATWKPGETAITYHWVRYQDDFDLTSAEARESVAWEGARADVPREVPPGAVVSVMIPVTARGLSGEALPPSAPKELWHYRVQWDVVAGAEGWFSQESGPAGEEAIGVLAQDTGVLFESVGTPDELPAGEVASVDIVAANAGPHAWRADESCVTYRWYRWDGRPLDTEVRQTPLPTDVAAGERASVSAGLLAPGVPGPYWLVWQIIVNGAEPGPSGEGRRADLAVSPVFVRSARVTPVDLSPYANVPGVATDTYRARGDFDGRGASLPAEWLPPDQTRPKEQLYPGGYYAPGAADIPVPFAFPASTSGTGGVVACVGQTIPLGEAGAKRVHILTASIEGTREATFGLGRESGEVEQAVVSVLPWDRRVEGASVSAYCPYVRTLNGDDDARQAYLYHLTLSASAGNASTLVLPKEPSIRILAVTVETE